MLVCTSPEHNEHLAQSEIRNAAVYGSQQSSWRKRDCVGSTIRTLVGYADHKTIADHNLADSNDSSRALLETVAPANGERSPCRSLSSLTEILGPNPSVNFFSAAPLPFQANCDFWLDMVSTSTIRPWDSLKGSAIYPVRAFSALSKLISSKGYIRFRQHRRKHAGRVFPDSVPRIFDFPKLPSGEAGPENRTGIPDLTRFRRGHSR